MNLYIIVEGRRTEKKVYPKWLEYLIPRLTRVKYASDVEDNNYYLFNGNGYPALLHNHLNNSIIEVNELGNLDYLIIILDVDESTVEARENEVLQFIKEKELDLLQAELIIIAQNRCIETWFLGNKSIFKSNPENEDLIKYTKYYNVKENDPEKMGLFDGFNTHSMFHAEYCTQFLRERKIRYSKNKPNGVIEPSYLKALIDRNNSTSDLESFNNFLIFCKRINKEMDRVITEK